MTTTHSRVLDVNGIITTVAGTGSNGYSGDGGAATNATLNNPSGIAMDSAGNLFVADPYNSCVRKIGVSTVVSGTVQGDMAFYEESGIGYTFYSDGRHSTSVDFLTGATIYTFGYDTANQLISITDRFGNSTGIERGANGTATAISSPYGVRTVLTTDGNNHLDRITSADGSHHSFEYGSTGLLTAKEEPNANRYEHRFDETGRLTDALDSAGGHWQYSKTVSNGGYIQVESLSAEGERTTYSDSTYYIQNS